MPEAGPRRRMGTFPSEKGLTEADERLRGSLKTDTGRILTAQLLGGNQKKTNMISLTREEDKEEERVQTQLRTTK